jgi:pimeloyl-ACP methyl ester carboxylesterase
MVRTVQPANRNRAIRRDLCVFLAGSAVWLVPFLWACDLAAAQPAPAAAPPGAKSPAKPAAKTAPQPAAPAAQPAKPAVAPASAVPPAKPGVGKDVKEAKEELPPAPESFYLRTKDQWNIFCTYYGPKKGVRRGKDAVPIILLHGWEGQGSEYADLATVLQSWGFASIVPDLRGHGRSVSRKKPNGEDEVVKVGDLKPADMDDIIYDVEAAKKVLVDKNNKAELNIDMLAVIGADVGAIVAVNWAALDWTWPMAGGAKQGQDVKALILLSPQQTFRRMNCNKALSTPVVSQRLSILLAVGNQGTREYSEAKRIHSRLERPRPAVPEDEIMQKKDLFLIEAATPLQGTKLLDRALKVNGAVMTFLDWRLLKKLEDFPWMERKNPLGGN